MRRSLLIAGLTMVASMALAQAPAGKPPLPPFLKYQMRDQAPAGNRLAPGRDGVALFSNKCGYCHLVGGMGTNLLTKLRAPDRLSGLLIERTDLKPDYVKYVVRNGFMAMPRISRTEVTNAELEAIAKYLAKGNK